MWEKRVKNSKKSQLLNIQKRHTQKISKKEEQKITQGPSHHRRKRTLKFRGMLQEQKVDMKGCGNECEGDV
ncbi:hypothetical protein STEG23_024336 [Scotinomys teguina]